MPLFPLLLFSLPLVEIARFLPSSVKKTHVLLVVLQDVLPPPTESSRSKSLTLITFLFEGCSTSLQVL